MKPDILVVTRNLPPLVGGMERLVWHLIDELRVDYRVHVVGPSGCKKELPKDVSAHELRLRPMVYFLLQLKFTVLWLALRHRPRIIFAGSGLTAPFVFVIARLIGARCIVYLHGLDIAVSHPVYRFLWIPFFLRFDSVLVNSHFTKQLAVNVQISPDRINILHPGVKLPNMHDAQERCNSFRTRHHFANLPIMLYVGRITPRKGLLKFVSEILPYIVKKEPTVVLAIVGDDPTDAVLSVGNECVRVEAVIKEESLEKHVNFLGCCSDKELSDAYFASNVLIFPLQQRSNDIEGFGMVAIEAAAHGLPTVAFSVGGVSDAVADGDSGRLITAGDNNTFAQAVVELLNKETSPVLAKNCRIFAEKFCWGQFGFRLREICRKVKEGNVGRGEN